MIILICITSKKIATIGSSTINPINYFALSLLIEANNEVLLHGTNNTSHLETLTVSLCVVLIGSSPNLKFLEDEGRDLGIIPDETISRNNLVDIGNF